MDPLSIAGLGASLIGGLFGGGGGIDLKELRKILSPQQIQAMTNAFFQQQLQSPFGRQALTSANLRGAQAGQALRRQAALAGGGTSSPLAALAASAGSVTQGLSRDQALSDLYHQSFGAAQANASQLAQLAAGLQPQVSPFGRTLSGIGQTLGDFSALRALNQASTGRIPSAADLLAASGGPQQDILNIKPLGSQSDIFSMARLQPFVQQSQVTRR